ncbi:MULTISPECIES: hypothetical protein [unclassified Rathayibacter]|uniref:hypothetical protein n=1 Tax=unclassified Rathayibacter TaxID=2609250 RepID=UPI0011CEC6B4|nr:MULTISPECIES: hypothetical protein [unclassified Rathayibacter]
MKNLAAPASDVEFFWAPLFVGLLLWLVAEGVRAIWRLLVIRRLEKIARREKIVSALGQARNITFRAVRDGLYEKAWVSESLQPLDETRRRYDDLTEQTLSLFREDEVDVAFWTAVEFYAGFIDPLYSLDQFHERNSKPNGFPRLAMEAEGTLKGGYVLPRPEMLLGWSKLKEEGPRFGMQGIVGDATRHRIVTPNSDSSMDMILPPVWTWRRQQGHRAIWPQTRGDD